jgi:hypothetical protein
VLEHELLDVVSPFQATVVLLDKLKFNPYLFLAVVFSELEVGEQELSVLVVLHLELVSFLVVALEEV